MWEAMYDDVNMDGTNDFYNNIIDTPSSQYELDCGYNYFVNYELGKDTPAVFTNLKIEDYSEHTYETLETSYQPINNGEQLQEQWQSTSDQLSQHVPVYNPPDNYYMHSNDKNYLLPTILDVDKNYHKTTPSIVKKRAGRPRGAKVKRSKAEPKLSRIWEFIRDLLLDSQYCPTYICWENYEEGRFRFVQSDKVAKLWGKFKRNERMNYEKFSRAMRYYYKTGVLLPVQGKRLVYKFGPKATGWHTNNPNFKYDF